MVALLLCLFVNSGLTQISKDSLTNQILAFQTEQNQHYLDKKTSPLTKKERKAFQGHHFFPIDLSYVVEATVQRIESNDTVAMNSSGGLIKYYKPYAKLLFKLNGVDCELMAYQSYKLMTVKEYENYLFVPFRDANSGTLTYGGGRYLDLLIPNGSTLILNFNLAYNPYCAYTSGYNCTIPPAENTLNVPVNAGLKTPESHE
jgi:uncharacterized protein (DUF1684 family)